MADPNQNAPPLLLFSANDSLAPDVLRPVPATSSLFPTEDGEADSFLGQTADVPSTQVVQPQVPFFSMPAASSSASADPFSSMGQPPSSNTNPAGSASPYAPSTTHQSVGFSGPPTTPQSTQYFNGPPMSTPGAQVSTPSGPLNPGGPPPSGPPTGPPQGSRTFSSGYGVRGQHYQPVIFPGMDGASQPAGGPQAQPMFDPSMPPPMSAASSHPQGHHQTPTRPQQGAFSLPGSPPQHQALGTSAYQPIRPHWFYCKEFERGEIWCPFSIIDSIKLEEAFYACQMNPHEDVIISTNGGRFDVSMQQRVRQPIYWEETPSSVRRCTWFYKSDGENRFLPYEEGLSDRLEEEYKSAIENNVWHKRLEFSDGETIVMHNPNVIVHFRPSSKPDDFGTSPDGQMRPRVVKRGIDDLENIQQGEPNKVDHLVFVIHGIGPVCDLRFRSIVECVDDFRSVSLSLLQSHFKHAQDDGRIGRIEFLPVYWYDALHGDATGVDRRLRRITLPSISRLRRFTNDTLLDILFYSSPTYSQKIAEQVNSEINHLFELFKHRNPHFQGQVSLVGHSLGSLIAFDLLSHQGDATPNLPMSDSNTDTPVTPDQPLPLPVDQSQLTANLTNEEEAEKEVMTLESSLAQLGLTEFLPKFEKERVDMESLLMCSSSDLKEMGLPMGPRKKLGVFVSEQATKEEKSRKAKEERLRAEAERATREAIDQERKEALSAAALDFSSHSVHVDYEPGSEGVGQPLVKYSQLDFKPQCFFAVGSPIGMFLTVRGVSRVGEEYKLPTCDGFFNIFHPFDPVAYRIEPLVHPSMADVKPFLMPHHKGRKRFHLELKESLTAFGTDLKRNLIDSMKKTWHSIQEFALAHRSETVPAVTSEEMEEVAEKLSMEEMKRQAKEREGISQRDPDFELRLGQLNSGRRIDYVLQEAPLESFNEYLFALGSHACYWDSEDTVLLILKEIYSLLGVFPLIHGPKQDSTPATPATPLHH
ncbi:triacylglycerol hydrolase DDHD2-like [Asterias amurensis]|uniref:triacylglycerol hydrolase DDHD2-like n=1 Tax=Asterias amurensis TaxID=7602 RepID=UPI003AB63A48